MHGKQRNLLFYSLLLLGATFAFSATVHAQPTMSPEELAVRTAYARITFGAEVEAVTMLAGKRVGGASRGAAETADATALQSLLQTGQPHFALSSVKIGDVAEIADTSLEDLVTQNTGTILELQKSAINFDVNGLHYTQKGVRASWKQQPPHGYSWRDIPVKMLQGNSGALFTRYAAYIVSTTLNSETSISKALVLFNPKGEVEAIDNLLNWSLGDYFNASIYPHVLLEVSILRSQPFVSSWLTSHAVTAGSCKADQQHECFDPASGAVGIHPADLEQSLTHPPTPRHTTPPVPGGVTNTDSPNVGIEADQRESPDRAFGHRR